VIQQKGICLNTPFSFPILQTNQPAPLTMNIGVDLRFFCLVIGIQFASGMDIAKAMPMKFFVILWYKYLNFNYLYSKYFIEKN
jgi:hypothetical protein